MLTGAAGDTDLFARRKFLPRVLDYSILLLIIYM